MTLREPIEYECTECGERQTVQAWRSLNVTVNPEAKDDLLKGEINVFRCRNCDNPAFIATDFMYHDMEREFCVWFFPFDSVTDGDFLKIFTAKGEWRADVPGPFGQLSSYMLHPHVVFDMDELARYVIFRDQVFEAGSAGVKEAS